MNQQDLEAIFGPAQQTQAPAAAPIPASPPAVDLTAGLTPEQLFGPAPEATAAAPAAPARPVYDERLMAGVITREQFDALYGGGAGSAAPAPADEQPGLASRIASDIGTGVTELPRAALKGARDAAQETLKFGADAGNWIGQQQDKLVGLFGGAPGRDVVAPRLPEVTAPESTTGKLASTVSQFIVGLVGLGKVAKPFEAAAGLAKAGRAAKIGADTAKAATVGAVAFDPYGPRLADLVESVPALTNPVTRYLKADPTDTAAEGRIKAALESIGMDAALVGGVLMSTKLYRVMANKKAGKATQAEVDQVIAEVEAVRAAEAQPQAVPVEAQSPAPLAPDAPLAQPLDAAAPAVARDVLDLGAAPAPSKARDVLDLAPAKQGAAVGGVAEPSTAPRIEVSPEQTTGLLKAMREDADALAKAGGDWNRAVDDGHLFGRGERIPWQKLRVEGPEGDGLDAFVRRLVDETEAQQTALRGGGADGVLSDASVQAMVADSSRLFGSDPAQVTGRLAMAGDAARRMAVELEVSYTAANRALQDAFALASRIKAGDLTEFAGDGNAAAEALRLQLADAATLFGYGQAIRAGAGRTMRRMRSEFGPQQADIETMRGLSPARLVAAVLETGGDPRSIAKLTSRSALQKLGDAIEFSYVNGLLWGPRSHFVNFATNAYMVGIRPLERIVGGGIIGGVRALKGLASADEAAIGAGLDAAGRSLQQGYREYVYIGASLSNAWKMAATAWQAGDSVLSPRSLENLTAPRINPAELRFKTPDNLSAVLHNAVVALTKTIGLPTRALGTVDEFVQQSVYRSQVQAKAHAEGAARGLEGEELTAFVRDRLHGAFDADLRATDAAALQEARTSTFQQDLLPGTFGHTIASAAVKHRMLRFVLPFVRTPTNVLRYGTKLTPVLNLAQAEYRQMLFGKMGAEAQAQAVGQMSLGALFLTLAGFYAEAGLITGSGPSDAKLRAALLSTGWQPYSVVKLNADGTRTYINYGRYDPVGLPFGIVADIVNAVSNADDEGWASSYVADAMSGALIGLAKQLSNKSYLKSLNDALEAFTDPDSSGEKYAGQVAANLIPFSSGLRFVNPDPHMRDARSIADKMLATVPGLSDRLPPRRDMWGDPITIHKGLWATDSGSLVDAEMRRMAAEAGFAAGPPSPNLGGVDLRDITMVDGRNAYGAYQSLAARPSKNGRSLKETVGRIIQSPAYQRAPDGDAGTRGTRLWMLSGVMAKYRQSAAQRMRGDRNVREAMLEKQRTVARVYAASKATPKSADQQGRQAIGDIGQAFGVDLTPLMQ